MSDDRDDDALRWEGDDEPPAATLPAGWHAVGKGSEHVETAPAEPAPADRAPGEAPASDAEPAPTGTAALVGYGIIGGIYLLYAIGWVVIGFRLQGTGVSLVSDAMFAAARWVAVLSPLLWFAATWVLTRRGKTWIRVLALLAGVVLLVPWPFVMMGVWGL